MSRWRSFRLKIDVTSLLQEIEKRYGRTFTTDDLAEMLHTTVGSAGQLLRYLADDGLVERLRNGTWRIRETGQQGDIHS